jgi:ABC-type Na+ efflux pump permease subunit
MSAFVDAWRDWSRRLFGRSDGALSWQEPLALLLAAGGAVGLGLAGGRLAAWQQVTLWGLLALALAAALRRGWLKLLGPVLFYDLVRTARRTRFVVIRTLYALLLAVVLCWLFLILCLETGWSVPSSRMSPFATGFFYTFMAVQFVTVVLLTPAYTAGAVAEEKERKTLEYLLATDLRNREIVLGKLVARMLNLSLLLLAGLPILGFLQFLGGVDPGLVLAGFAATALTMFSLAGLSIYNSVQCRRARDAIVLTYLGFLAYHLLAGVSRFVYWPTLGLADFPSTPTWTSPVTLGDLSDWFNAGNIVYAIYRLGSGRSTVLEQVLPGVLRDYAIFHGLVGCFCIGRAIARLRVVALRDRVSRPRPRTTLGPRPRPAVGNAPMVWKEVYAEGGLRLNSVGRIVMGVLVVASFLPTFIIFYLYLDGKLGYRGSTPWREVSDGINAAQERFVGTVVACLMLLAVVVRAANSVSGERERDTLDALLTSPLRAREIVFGKWVGAVLSVRWGWLWLGLIWGVGVVTGGLQIYALPLLVVSWLVYATVLAGVGLWLSAASRRTLRATVGALMLTLLLCGGHWLLTGMFCYMPLAALGVRRDLDWLLYVQAGQTPPFVLGLFAFRGDEFTRSYQAEEMAKLTAASVVGVVVWAASVAVLWRLVLYRFRQATGRGGFLRPERIVRLRPRPASPAPHPNAVHRPPEHNDRARRDGEDEPLWALPAEAESGDKSGPAPPPV